MSADNIAIEIAGGHTAATALTAAAAFVDSKKSRAVIDRAYSS
jgi:hypothetical protein